MSSMTKPHNADVEFYTELLSDGRTAVRTRYLLAETCLRPVIQTENDIYVDAADAVAYCMIMSSTTAFLAFATHGQTFLDRLTKAVRDKKITSWPIPAGVLA